MGHGDEQRLTFLQRLADQAELEILQIAQAAVEQLGRGRGGALRQIALFGQGDGQAAPRGVARDAAAVDAAADDEKIADRVGHRQLSRLCSFLRALCQNESERASFLLSIRPGMRNKGAAAKGRRRWH